METKAKQFFFNAARSRFFVTVLLFVAVLSSPLNADDSPRVSLSPGPHFIGEPIIISITIPGTEESHQVDLSQLAETEARIFEAAPLKGSTSPAFLIRIRVLATRAGLLEIPSLRVFGPAGVWQTDPLSLKIREPEPTDTMQLSVRFEKDRVYLGEPFVVEVEWSFDQAITAIHAVDLRLPIAESPLFKTSPHRTGAPLPGKEIGLPVSQARMMAHVEDRTIRFRQVVIPLEAGFHSLPPATLLASRSIGQEQSSPAQTDSITGFQYPPYFDNQFFNTPKEGDFERVFTRSKRATIEVLPLPEAGRPPDFTGIVGSFSLKTAVQPDRGSFGSPLSLELKATGYRYPEVLNLPRLADLPGFSGRFDPPTGHHISSLEEESGAWVRILRQNIRPLATGVEFVPRIRISYFDPERRQYKTATAPALPLQIGPAAMATAFDATLSDGSRIRNRLEPNPAGIGAIYLATSLRSNSSRAPIPAFRFWLATLAIPPLLFLTVLRLTHRHRLRRRDPARANVRYAFKDFQREGRQAGERRSTQRSALRRYFARRLNATDAALTPGSILLLLQRNGFDPARFSHSLGFLQQHEKTLFAQNQTPGATSRTWMSAVEEIRTFENQSGHSAYSFRSHFPTALLLTFVGGIAFWTLSGAPAAALPDPALPHKVIREAEGFFRSGVEQQFDRPNEADKDFERAAALYELALDKAGNRFDRARLHYNAGSARFFSNEFGRALTHFFQTLALDPTEPLSRRAISHIRAERIDTIQSDALRWTLSMPFKWQKLLNDPTRRLLLSSSVFAFWTLCLVSVLRANRFASRGAIAAGLLTLTLAIGFFIDHRHRQLNGRGVIVVPEVTARQGDGLLYEPALQSSLHDGFEFLLLERRGDWLRIQPNHTNDPVWIPARSALLMRIHHP